MNRLAIAAVGLALVVTAGCTIQFGGDIAGHYENAELGFAFDYPEQWEQVEVPFTSELRVGEPDRVASAMFGRLVEDPPHVEGVAVSVAKQTPVIPDEDLERALLQLDDLAAEVAALAGDASLNSDWTELGGRVSRRHLLSFPHPGTGERMTGEQVITFRHDLRFDVHCQALAEHFEEVRSGCQVVYDSFQFTSEQ